MVTEFDLIDENGKVIGRGEMEGGVYRLFKNATSTDYKQYDDLSAMLADSGGDAIQPSLFQTPARLRQLNLIEC